MAQRIQIQSSVENCRVVVGSLDKMSDPSQALKFCHMVYGVLSCIHGHGLLLFGPYRRTISPTIPCGVGVPGLVSEVHKWGV